MKKKYTLFLFMSILVVVLLLPGCSSSPTTDSTGETPTDNGEIVLYSNRNERFVQAMLDKFTEDTGIKVIALHGANPLQIQEESNNVRADIFISNDLGALGYLDGKGLLKASNPAGIETIPIDFRADNNSYFAISARARGFIYNKDLITEDQMPKSIEDLTDPKWKSFNNGFAITRGGNSGMIGHVSALRYQWGDERTSDWIAAVKDNASGIYEGHGNIRKAVGAGEHVFGLVNNYYFHQQLIEPTDNNVGFIYIDQDEDQMGVVANAAGVGLVNGGPNEENALIFLEWLLLPENQVAFVGESLELLINSQFEAIYPPEVEPYIVDFNQLKVQDMPIKQLGYFFEDTRALIERSGLDLELK